MTKLKPCPFCGGEAAEATNELGCYVITCSACGCTSQAFLAASTEWGIAAARKAWNRRALKPSPLDDIISERGHIELEPCPFCGYSNLYLGELNGPLEDGATVYVRCLDCGATIEGEGVNPDKKMRREWALDNAVARWNTRKGTA